MKITLIGYMGAGKSSLGQALAQELHLPFFDLDSEIEKDTGYTITETIFNKGELFFRKLEREHLLKLLNRKEFVLSTGGGTPCYYDNIEEINRQSLSIYLKYGVKDLYERLEGEQSERPLIAHLEGPALREFIGKHLFERNLYYEKATQVINAKNQETNDILKTIKKLVK